MYACNNQRKFPFLGNKVKLILKPLLQTRSAWLGYTENTRKDKLPNANIQDNTIIHSHSQLSLTD